MMTRPPTPAGWPFYFVLLTAALAGLAERQSFAEPANVYQFLPGGSSSGLCGFWQPRATLLNSANLYRSAKLIRFVL
jgi:hypothetical protein